VFILVFDAALLLNGNHRSEFAALLFFWSEVLSFIDRIQKCHQAKETTSHQALNQPGTLTSSITGKMSSVPASSVMLKTCATDGL
jgi:hypothetical protein